MQLAAIPYWILLSDHSVCFQVRSGPFTFLGSEDTDKWTVFNTEDRSSLSHLLTLAPSIQIKMKPCQYNSDIHCSSSAMFNDSTSMLAVSHQAKMENMLIIFILVILLCTFLFLVHKHLTNYGYSTQQQWKTIYRVVLFTLKFLSLFGKENGIYIFSFIFQK